MKFINIGNMRVVLLACSVSLAALGGEPKQVVTPSVPLANDPWVVTLNLPGWLAGLEGTTGVRGYTAQTDVPFSSILENLDMIAAGNIEVQKGRWGGWIDGMYMKLSVGAETPGPLLDSLDVGLEQVTAEAAVFYRAWNGGRGYLDVYAGARYMWISGELGFNVSDSGVAQVSQQLSQQVIDEVVGVVKGELDAATSGAVRAQIASQATTAARSKVSASVAEKATSARSTLNQVRQIAAAHPRLAKNLRNSTRLEAAIRSVAEARLDEKVAQAEEKATRASTAADAVKAAALAAVNRAKSNARKAIAKAEKRLASEIEDVLQEAIPSHISQSVSWVDPFVGLRARYNFNERLYAIGKADIGGFGVSSDWVWTAYGALGCHLTKSGKTTVELGYKHMAVDYTRGGFTYDVALSGLMLNLGIKF